jgi:hypothetical protein
LAQEHSLLSHQLQAIFILIFKSRGWTKCPRHRPELVFVAYQRSGQAGGLKRSAQSISQVLQQNRHSPRSIEGCAHDPPNANHVVPD